MKLAEAREVSVAPSENPATSVQGGHGGDGHSGRRRRRAAAAAASTSQLGRRTGSVQNGGDASFTVSGSRETARAALPLGGHASGIHDPDCGCAVLSSLIKPFHLEL